MITGRFAPSPSGPLHLGNLRTALIAWLSARSAGGRFLVRIEDLDALRSSAAHEASQLRDLARIGIDWDAPPIRQSQRGGAYGAAIARLIEQGDTYECFCTRREIADATRAPNEGDAERPYPGTCRELSDADRARRRAERPAAIRLRADGERVDWVDRVLGPMSGTSDDLVIQRNDGAAAYHLAVVVDDHDSGVTEVVRGDDLASSTPRQIVVARRLGLSVPAYGHVPLVRGPDGTRLAKRHGAVTLDALLADGSTVDAVVRALLRSMGPPAPEGVDGLTATDGVDDTRAPEGVEGLGRLAVGFDLASMVSASPTVAP